MRASFEARRDASHGGNGRGISIDSLHACPLGRTDPTDESSSGMKRFDQTAKLAQDQTSRRSADISKTVENRPHIAQEGGGQRTESTVVQCVGRSTLVDGGSRLPTKWWYLIDGGLL